MRPLDVEIFFPTQSMSPAGTPLQLAAIPLSVPKERLA
jgi:hypothetical protein